MTNTPFNLKHYPAYKGSGVSWLGDVPAHWEISRLKNKAANVVEQTSTTRSGESYIGLEHVESWTGRVRQPREQVHFESQLKRFQPNDVLFGKLRPYLAKVTKPTCNGACVSEFFVIRSRTDNVCPAFLEHLFRSKPIIDVVDSSTFGARMPRADWNFVGSLRLAYPPPAEQAAIVRFLDHVDQRIRRYIRAKQKLIKLLEEQKQAIVHRAVTRGLDPNVRLKSSGVEWLCDVPEHWEVKRLRQLTDPERPVMYGIVLPGPNVDEGVYVVKGGNCEPGRLRPERLSRTTFEIESRYVRSRLVGQDIVFAIRGGVGAAEFVPPELTGANLTQDAARIAAAKGVNVRWLLNAVRAPIFQEHVRSQVVGATVRGINIRNLKRIQIVVPPLDEQGEIVRYLEAATASIFVTVERAHREIFLLRGYRTRLIADVVTGKLDVRAAAADLPDEIDKPDLMEETQPLDEAEAAQVEESSEMELEYTAADIG